jgi:hypothetical protein
MFDLCQSAGSDYKFLDKEHYGNNGKQYSKNIQKAIAIDNAVSNRKDQKIHQDDKNSGIRSAYTGNRQIEISNNCYFKEVYTVGNQYNYSKNKPRISCCGFRKCEAKTNKCN